MIIANKKGSTANATSSNNNFINHYANDNSDNNANLLNILVQRGLIVNYSPDCLVLRFSDLSFFSQASITHAEKLEFSCSTLVLISSINSCGKRICFLVDLLFTSPVAIDTYSLSIVSVNTPYTRIRVNKSIDVGSHFTVRWVHTIIMLWLRNDKTPQCSSTNGVSNHNVKRGNTMAMYKSTQTHPKFLWRFFSCQQSKYFSVEASNEQEARSMLPDSPCLFSARIRQGANHA